MAAASSAQAMPVPTRQLLLAGQEYRVWLAAADGALQVEWPVACRLPVWRYGDHLAALRQALTVAGGKLSLNAERLAQQVLARGAVPFEQLPALLPLALWWAAGGDGMAVQTQPDGVSLAGLKVRLEPWSERQRLSALLACLVAAPDTADTAGATTGQTGQLDPVSYLDAMVRASIASLEPALVLDELPAATALALVDAVVALNLPDLTQDPLLAGLAAEGRAGDLARQSAAQTLRLCRALGWTPAQVWSAPAAEVDRLLAMLDATLPVAPPTVAPAARKPRRLADLPDAVLIRIDD